ncbi:MAG TPA: redoxin domain-containing protein [Pirellulales bacterium]|nr:redoxin domain-containing protein [Pirellulales bacterium]
MNPIPDVLRAGRRAAVGFLRTTRQTYHSHAHLRRRRRTLLRYGLVIALATCSRAGLAEPGGPAPIRRQTAASPAAPAEDASPGDAPDLDQTLLFAIREPAVRRELKLQPRQVQAIEQALAEVDPPLWALRDEPPAQRTPKATQLRASFVSRMAALLQGEQKRRLDQIVLQTLSLSSLATPQMAERLALSRDQQQRVRRALADAESAASERQPTGGKQAAQAAARRRQAEARRRMLGALTDEQQERFIGLLGEPFDTSRIRQAAARAPELKDISAWLNSPPLSLEQLQGKVVALHFWAFGCINCVHNLPLYQGWDEAYAARGLVLLGVHTPETTAEKDANRVQQKVQENGMRYPVAIDMQGKTWQAWTNRMWPSVYLIDKRGYVRYWWYGELNWQGAQGDKFMRAKIEELLAEKD